MNENEYQENYHFIVSHPEVVAREMTALRAEVARLNIEVDTLRLQRNAKRRHRDALRVEVERLRAALREAYEVYAGSEDFIPETCGEGYQRQIIKQMVGIINAALEEEPSE